MYLAHHSVVVLVDCVPRGWDPLILSELMRAAHTKHKSGKRNAKDPIPHAARRGGEQHCGHLWIFFMAKKQRSWLDAHTVLAAATKAS